MIHAKENNLSIAEVPLLKQVFNRSQKVPTAASASVAGGATALIGDIYISLSSASATGKWKTQNVKSEG